MARSERYIVGLDIGTSKVCTVVGEVSDDGSLDIIGIGVAESKGLKRGVVVNLEAAVDSIKKSVEEAELMAGVEIDAAHLAVSGPHIKGFNSRGVVAVAGKNREIGYSFRYFFVLFTEVKFFNNCSVTVDFSLVKIIKKASTLTN